MVITLRPYLNLEIDFQLARIVSLAMLIVLHVWVQDLHNAQLAIKMSIYCSLMLRERLELAKLKVPAQRT